jgi:hypothetical protein
LWRVKKQPVLKNFRRIAEPGGYGGDTLLSLCQAAGTPGGQRENENDPFFRRSGVMRRSRRLYQLRLTAMLNTRKRLRRLLTQRLKQAH